MRGCPAGPDPMRKREGGKGKRQIFFLERNMELRYLFLKRCTFPKVHELNLVAIIAQTQKLVELK